MTSRSPFAYSAPLAALIVGVYWLADVARLGYGIPVRSGSMVWGTVGMAVLVVGAVGAWRGARWAPEVWLLGFITMVARVGYVIYTGTAGANGSPVLRYLVLGIWLTMAIGASHHAWVARQARARAR